MPSGKQITKWSLGTLAVLFVIGLFAEDPETDNKEKPETRSNQEAEKKSAPEYIAYAEHKLSSEEFRDQIKEAKNLFDQLMEYKEERKFQIYGFGSGAPTSKYRDWKDRAESLAGRTDAAFMRYTGTTVRDLIMIATHYAMNEGRDDDITKDKKSLMEEGLKVPPKIGEGEGITLSEKPACETKAPLEAQAKAWEEDDYTANPTQGCGKIPEHTVVTGPLSEHKADHGDDWFIQAKLPDGRKVWTYPAAVVFHLN